MFEMFTTLIMDAIRVIAINYIISQFMDKLRRFLDVKCPPNSLGTTGYASDQGD